MNRETFEMKTEFSGLQQDLPIDGELEAIVESAIERAKKGQSVDIEQLAMLHPNFAEQLRTLLPTIEMLMRFGDASSQSGRRGGRKNGAAIGLGREELLGDFRLLGEIGRGGMGVVYEAEQLSMGRRVALKILPFVAIAEDKALQRFRNEVRAAAALDHPHIVSVYSVGEERGVHYYAMQLVRGQSLAELIRQLRTAGREPAASPPEQSTNAFEVASYISNSPPAQPAPAESDVLASTQHEQARLNTVVDSRSAVERFRTVARLG